ncbi:ataxin-7-like protein 1 [Plakobranchus ocellatus]|uniref:Ataxin-7-like protein 1 n=1 Tax=Plakobranchus ocellatus TaxID=259542 RepID=A0AAV4DLQ8_9GAST|nr:ataxin-7-like protein 1 [Plakobranchus ocellatus]
MTSHSGISVSTESNKKIKMATQDTSPSLIIGQQWSALTELLSSGTSNHEDELEKDENKNASDSMKLGRHDMGLFGFCPSREEFSLVVCEKCKLLVKPQALKQHIETRHGSTNLSSLGTIPPSALNSELGKKLLMPLPSKSSTPPPPPPKNASSVDRQASGTFKPVSSGKPPTKASLKQVPASIKNSPAPLLGVSMKISPIKSVKAGNRISSSSSTSSVQSSSMSNPVVKVEKLSKLPAPSAQKSESKQELAKSDVLKEKSGSVMSIDSSKISTLMNGSLKTAMSFTSPGIVSSSLISTPMHVTVTKTSTDTPVSTRSVTTLVTTTTLTKPVMIAPVMTISSAVSMTSKPSSAAKGAKGSKDHKEKKNLPCKDREYDANKHCGVTVSETGKQCTRSLTCKTHALSLRRAVTGRSKSFDDLLKEHKAANDAYKAKASSQAAAAVAMSGAGLPGSSPKRVLISPGIMNSSLSALKQHPIAPAQKDGKLAPPGSAVSTLQAKIPLSTVPTTTTKPRNMFQRFSSSAILPPVITVKEDLSVKQEPTRRPSQTPTSTESAIADSQDTKPDPSYLPHHPKPMATCQFGGRLNDRGSLLFSRKMDYVRAAFLSALERQLNPPPHKKLCVESNLPKESQMQSNSQDPYDFNIVDTSGTGATCGGTTQTSSVSMSASLVNIAKPTLKPKSKTPSSPGAVACTNPLTLPTINLTPASGGGSLSLSSTPIMGCPSGSPSGLALNWSVKTRDNSLSRSPTASPSPLTSNMPNPGKRKRSGSSGASGGGGAQQLIAVAASSNSSLPLTPAVSIAPVSITGASAATQQTGFTGVITSSSLNSQHSQSGNFITIPNVNLTSANLSQLNAGTLGAAAKISSGNAPSTTSVTAASSTHSKNNLFKDFNLVLTGIDSSSLVNGQYMNLTGAHLAELAASQGQTLVLNNFNPAAITTGGSLSGATISLAGAGGVTTTSASNTSTSRPAKRIRSSSAKSGSSSSASSHHLALAANSSKLQTGALEGIKLIPSSSLNLPSGLPPNAVLMDSSSLQGAVLTSVALGTGGTTPTLVAITSSMASNSQMLCAVSKKDSASTQLLNSSTIVNGLCSSSSDKSSSNSQRHHISKSHHHHHQHQHHQQNSSKAQQQQQQGLTLGSMLQSAGNSSIAVPLAQGAAGTAQLCSSQAIFKQGGTTFNLTKTVGGKVTMQPVSLTFPINVSQAGLVALTSSKQQQQTLQQQLQQQQQQQQQHTLLVSSSTGSGGELVDASAVRVTGKSDMHLQAQLSSSSPGNLIS